MASDHDERIARVLARYPGEEHTELRALIADLVADFDARLGQRDSLIATLTGRLGLLESAVEGLQRAGKRQAAPFAKRAPKANPKKSGRKPGEGYGPRAHRAVPQRLPDRELRADLPGVCPDCGGEIDAEGEASQWIEDIAITTVITEVVVAKGRCRCCRRRVQGRHPDQVSDALGAASSQLGPVAQGLIAIWPRSAACRMARWPGCFASWASPSPPAGSPKCWPVWPPKPIPPTRRSRRRSTNRRRLPPTRPAGASAAGRGGCGPLPSRRPRSTWWTTSAASRRPPRFLSPTTTA